MKNHEKRDVTSLINNESRFIIVIMALELYRSRNKRDRKTIKKKK